SAMCFLGCHNLNTAFLPCTSARVERHISNELEIGATREEVLQFLQRHGAKWSRSPEYDQQANPLSVSFRRRGMLRYFYLQVRMVTVHFSFDQTDRLGSYWIEQRIDSI
ncbi:hypothetical protein JXA47_10815, partial [Candidatus Sumerlaeota bacterium]|nr:hypothetical protein [Candidatus Sumerlaeota bacterium]